MKKVEGNGIHTNEQANKIANVMTANRGAYYTAIKKEPINPKKPDYCWAWTNRFDPRVTA